MNFFKKTLSFFALLFSLSSFLFLSVSPANAACPDPILTQTGHTDHANSVDFHFSLKNCANAGSAKDYKLTADLPGGSTSGWKIDFKGTNVNSSNVAHVGRDAVIKFDGIITPPATASVGNHKIPGIFATQVGNSNSKDGVKNITYIVTDECKRLDPSLTTGALTKTAAPGTTITYTISLKNNNIRCAASDFNLNTLTKPTGFTVTFLKDNGGAFSPANIVQNVKSQETRVFKVKVKTSDSATGNNNIKFETSDKSKPANKDNITLKFTAQTTNACTVQGQNKPHFECQNNSCVSVNTCAGNSGGCTAAGGACGTTCTAPNLPTHFECQNNACVAVNTCGQNNGGCTAAGGSCGVTQSTKLNFTIGLDTIGTTGTNRVATFVSSNKNPKRTKRDLSIKIYNSSNQLVNEANTNINYDSTASSPTYGKFTGNITLVDDFPTGSYIIKVTVPGFLTKQIPGTVNLIQKQPNNLALVNLTAGDINTDNTIDIKDYNIFISCSIFAKTTAAKAACATNTNHKIYSDLNDEGNIDQFDYIYFIQEYSIQNGD